MSALRLRRFGPGFSFGSHGYPAVAFSPSGGLLAIADGGSVTVFRVNEETGILGEVDHVSPGSASSVTFSHDGGLLAVGGLESVTVFKIDQDTDKLERPGDTASSGLYDTVSLRLAFSPGDRLLATANEGGSVSVFKVDEAGGRWGLSDTLTTPDYLPVVGGVQPDRPAAGDRQQQPRIGEHVPGRRTGQGGRAGHH